MFSIYTYNDLGQLTCILCKSVVKSDAVWKVHINTKAHKTKVEIAKQLKENSTSVSPLPKKSHCTTEDYYAKRVKLQLNLVQKPEQFKREHENVITSNETLPEGFFDDPIKDAKLRNAEYKDPNQDEWERFQKEIKEEAILSNAIIAGEQDEATADRQIKEIDEQIQRWNKVLDLEKKKELVSGQERVRSRKNERDGVSAESQSEDEKSDDFEEFPDWRAKKFIQ